MSYRMCVFVCVFGSGGSFWTQPQNVGSQTAMPVHRGGGGGSLALSFSQSDPASHIPASKHSYNHTRAVPKTVLQRTGG